MLPINNLKAKFDLHRSVIDHAVKRVVDRGWVVLGPEVVAFEKAFSEYIGVNYCVGVANGTDAIELALRALGVSAGDLVATVANAGMYTSTAIMAIGALPWFMDVEVSTQNVTFDEVVRATKMGCRAVVITHLYGRAVTDTPNIVQYCDRVGIPVLEDCAQAHGARLGQRCAGSFGSAAAFSFYPTKNLGGVGDGGAIVTNSPEVAADIVMLRQYGWSAKYAVSHPNSRNSRLDEIQAAVLLDFLPLLDEWNSRRREIARAYSNRILHPSVRVCPIGGDEYVGHLFVVRTDHRSSLRHYLGAAGIASDVHYPVPDHRQLVFRDNFANLILPETEVLANEVLTLPCFPEMTDADIDKVVDTIGGWVP